MTPCFSHSSYPACTHIRLIKSVQRYVSYDDVVTIYGYKTANCYSQIWNITLYSAEIYLDMTNDENCRIYSVQ